MTRAYRASPIGGGRVPRLLANSMQRKLQAENSAGKPIERPGTKLLAVLWRH